MKVKKQMLGFFAIFLISIFLLLPLNVSQAATATSTGATSVNANVAPIGCTNCGGDHIAPAAISDLTAGSVTASTVNLSWAATGDDNFSGTAAYYDVRYYTHSITNETDWNNATVVYNPPTPRSSGLPENYQVTGLSSGVHYYFAIRVGDEVTNWSAISNIAEATTSGPADITPPILSDIQATFITGYSSTITWSTNENSDSKVVYGISSGSYSDSAFASQLVTAHSLGLSGLSAQTQYFYRVVSKDASNNVATSSEYNFTTRDSVPPVISDVVVSNITGVSAKITWTTNEAASSTVILGTVSGDYNLTPVSSSTLVLEHIINLNDLTPNTTYYFKVKSADAGFNESTSDQESSFQTLDTVPPVISSVLATPLIRSVTITWQTNKVADSQVAYGLTHDFGSLKSNATLEIDHSISIGSLEPNTRYYYVVRSSGENTAQTSSELLEFTTLSDHTAPANVANAKATAGDRVVDLSWTNPADSDFAGVIIKSSTTDYPSDATQGAQVYKGNGQSFQETGLTNGVLIYYSIFAYDTSNNYSSGALVNATPSSGPITPPPPPPPPPPPGGGDYTLKIDDFIFTVAKGKIFVPSSIKMNTLVGSDFGVSLDSARLRKSVENILLNFNNNIFFLRFDAAVGKWSAEITVPSQPGTYQADIFVTYQDKGTSLTSWQAQTLPYGQIFETKDDVKIPVVGATVSLLTSPTLWPAEAYGQVNPQITDANGSFGFLVPPNKYILKVEKEGYHTTETGYFDSNGVVINRDVELILTPPTIQEIIKPGATITDNAQAIAKNLGQKTVYVTKILSSQISATANTVTKDVQQFIDNPIVKETTNNIIAPTVAGAAAVGTTATIGFSQLFLYLRFLFTQPLLLFKRRRRRGWGVVYNALTKMPLDLVIMRLIDARTNRVVQSRVTDKDGRYAFLPDPGKYHIEINQPNFVYPTSFFSSLKEDYPYMDLYHGEEIEVKEKGAIVTPNIPLDPTGVEIPMGKILWKLVWRRFQHTFSVVSLLLSLAFFAISPSILTGILWGVQIGMYLLFIRLAYPSKPKSWGIIYDVHTKKPLKEAIVRIFDEQYNKLLETQITDHKGRYSFLVGRNAYYVMSEKNGYERKKSDTVDLRQHKESVASLGLDLGLKKGAVTIAPPPVKKVEVTKQREDQNKINNDSDQNNNTPVKPVQ